jgi:hypothetical protein
MRKLLRKALALSLLSLTLATPVVFAQKGRHKKGGAAGGHGGGKRGGGKTARTHRLKRAAAAGRIAGYSASVSTWARAAEAKPDRL